VFPADLAGAYQEAHIRRAAHRVSEGEIDSGASEGATDPGPGEDVTDSVASEGQRCDASGQRSDESVAKERQIRTPSPQSFPQYSSFLSECSESDEPVASLNRRDKQTIRERNSESSVSKTQESQYPPAVYQELEKIGVDLVEANEVIAFLVAEHRPRSASWWRTVGRNGDLVALVAEARHSLQKAKERRTAAAAGLELRRALARTTPRVEAVYVPPGTKSQTPRIRGCTECKWGFIHDTTPARPCPTCQPGPEPSQGPAVDDLELS
jgi:hypothetical protein